jgi:hypothetical protein
MSKEEQRWCNVRNVLSGRAMTWKSGYLRAAELNQAGMDGMQIMPLSPEDPRARLVAEFQADGSFDTREVGVVAR